MKNGNEERERERMVRKEETRVSFSVTFCLFPFRASWLGGASALLGIITVCSVYFKSNQTVMIIAFPFFFKFQIPLS